MNTVEIKIHRGNALKGNDVIERITTPFELKTPVYCKICDAYIYKSEIVAVKLKTWNCMMFICHCGTSHAYEL